MPELAAVILAHRDPSLVRRLVTALTDVPVLLHCDARTADPIAEEMVRGLPARVTVLPRSSTRLGSWSLVDVELTALRAAVSRTRAEHIAVLSGADYPLMSVPDLVDELVAWRDRSYLWNVRLPYRSWSTPRHQDGGLWRLRHRFLTRKDHVLYLRRFPLYWPWRRSLPEGLELRASSQWKVYARHHVERLLGIADTQPELIRFWRTTLVPEESFAASVLATPAFMGSDALPPCRAHPWFIRWPVRKDHPHWLTGADFDELAAARWADPVHPDDASRAGTDEELPGRKLFARKFTTDVDTDVLDRIDVELRA
jgi:hypothetical protein